MRTVDITMLRHAARISRTFVLGLASDTLHRVQDARRAWALLHLPEHPREIPDHGSEDEPRPHTSMTGTDLDPVEEASQESFPASDPPGWIGSRGDRTHTTH
jgi:hypothetical protein